MSVSVEEILGFPIAKPFSSFQPHGTLRGGDGEHYGFEENILLDVSSKEVDNSFQENYLLFLLKTLPKDRYRVIVLLLILKNELGYDFTYDDIGSLWQTDKASISKIVSRIRQVCVHNNIKPYGMD